MGKLFFLKSDALQMCLYDSAISVFFVKLMIIQVSQMLGSQIHKHILDKNLENYSKKLRIMLFHIYQKTSNGL